MNAGAPGCIEIGGLEVNAAGSQLLPNQSGLRT